MNFNVVSEPRLLEGETKLKTGKDPLIYYIIAFDHHHLEPPSKSVTRFKVH